MFFAVLVIVGLALGSFVNALVWRLHEQESKTKKAKREYSILRGRSMCPSCRHVLAARDLVPVFSWLWLRGRCRYCNKPISWQYPLVELLTAGLFVLSYVVWPHGFDGLGIAQFVLWLIFLVAFMALAVYDLRWKLLPNRVTLPLIVLAFIHLAIATAAATRPWSYLLLTAISLLLTAGLFYVLFTVSKGTWIGGGDVKLAVTLGILLASPGKALLMLFLASLLGSLVAVPMLVRGRANRRSQVPFGPFLLMATVVCYLWGAVIIDWYQRTLIG